MAHGPVALRRIGLGVGAVVIALTLGPLLATAAQAPQGAALATADWAAIRFTLCQALLSALISTLAAIPVARALARRRFWGRRALITLMGAPFLLPVIIAIMGLLAVFGRSGLIADLTGWQINIYGLRGVVLAHVFLNLPLAVRLLLQGWSSIPGEQFRLAAGLRLGAFTRFRTIEWPMLCRYVPGIMAVITLICMTSFAVALILGGGPRATTVELAIYQAIRFDFDLGHGALLALVQVGLCLSLTALSWRVAAPATRLGGVGRARRRWDAPGGWGRVLDGVLIAAAALFLLVPLGATLWGGLAGLGDLNAGTARAAARSLAVALGSAALCTGLASGVALRAGSWGQAIAALPLAVSSLVLGTGLFILIRPFAAPPAVALPVTALVNALLSLPFALRALLPAAEAVEAEYGRLRAATGMSTRTWLRWVWLPALRRPLSFGAAIAAAFSMGDLGVITLFATSSGETLPLHMYRLIGAYRNEAAAGAGLVLVVLTLALFAVITRMGGRDAQT